MIYLNISYFDTIMGPQTFCTVPSEADDNIEEYTNTLLNISEYIDLKFFVYVSSPQFKTSNIYTKIPSEWARGKLEMLLISIILVDEHFNQLFVFEEVLQKIVKSIANLKEAYMAFYSGNRKNNHINEIEAKTAEIKAILESYLPEIHQTIENAKKLPIESEVIETDADIRDEYVILQRDETVFDASKKLATSPKIVIGCILDENDKPVGLIDENDILNEVLLKHKDPLQVKVEDIMIKDIIMVDANDPIDTVIEVMLERELQAVPIIQDKRFIGAFTIYDAATHNKNIIEIISTHLQEISKSKLEDVKKIQVKLWSYIRNISKNRKMMQSKTQTKS